ncbi:hypothetical protein FD755_000192 [Muntiacus reevesi]|uniref:Nucleolar protein 5A n=1 Tax=Muntiacus reevesi TaxID=9886 RepID=A0A5J5MYF2_MUNRE|nr:hypothetical protein FD755_000192 [Muntiacus reevesi]
MLTHIFSICTLKEVVFWIAVGQSPILYSIIINFIRLVIFIYFLRSHMPCGPKVKKLKTEAILICLQCKMPGFDPWVGKIPWRREFLHTLIFLSGEFYGQRNLAGNSTWTLNMRVRRICCLTNLEMMPLSLGNIILLKEKGGTRGALKTRGNTPKYGLIFHSTFIGRAAAKNKGRISQYLANKCKQVEERLSFYETGEIPRKNLDEAAAEITRKLEKQKKRLKKEKKRLAAIALASSENSSAPEEYPSVSFSKPKTKKYFSKEELASSDLEETAGTGSLPKRKKSFPKEETVTDPDESENKMVPKKKRKLSKEEPLSSGPEEAAASKSSGSKKKKKLRKLSLES